MALDQQYIDKVSETIANQVEILQEEVVRDLLKLSKDIRFKTVDEFLFAMEQLDIEEMVILKAKNILDGYNVAHKEILTGMVLFGEMMDTHRAVVKPVKDRPIVAFRAITTTIFG